MNVSDFELHKNTNETKVVLAKVRESIPQLIEMYAMKAEMCKAYYEELLKQGFTEAQALEITSKMSMFNL